MSDVTKLASAALLISTNLMQLVREMRAEPVWQLQHLIGEPERSHMKEYVDSARRVQSQLRALQPVIEEIRDVAEGRRTGNQVNGDTLLAIKQLVSEGPAMQESFNYFLKWARGLRQVEDDQDEFDLLKN